MLLPLMNTNSEISGVVSWLQHGVNPTKSRAKVYEEKVSQLERQSISFDKVEAMGMAYVLLG